MVEPVILLVEDDDLTRVSVACSLRQGGYHVFTAASRCEARLLLERRLPDLVILDLGLPDGEGLSLGPTLAAAGIPYLVISGRADAPALSRAAGARACLTKPLGLADLNLKVFLTLRADH